MTLEKQKAISKLDTGLKEIVRVITEKGGGFEKKTEIQVIGGGQERDIEEMLAGMQMINADGTSQEDDEEEGMEVADDEELN